MEKLPEPLKELVHQLTRLPGLGPKSALRMAMTLLKWGEHETKRLGSSIFDLKDKLKICNVCGSLADNDPCQICTDSTRSDDMLCVVNEWDSLISLEEGRFFNGRYFILGGLLSPLDNVNVDDLELDKLILRLQNGNFKEIVLALGSTIEAENTANLVRSVVKKEFPDMIISRLAQGIPLGSEIKFMDKETLKQSLQYRQNL